MKKILKSLILVFMFMFAFAVVANADETELDETNVQENVQEEKIEGKVEEEKTEEVRTDNTVNEEQPVEPTEKPKQEEVKVEEGQKSEVPTKEETKTEEPKRDEPTKADSDEPTVGKVNVVVIDTRTGSPIYTLEALSDATSTTAQSVFNMFKPNMSEAFIINEKLYTHKFIGFFDAAEGGTQITSGYSNSTLYDGLSRITCNSTVGNARNYNLTVKANEDLTTEKTVYVYARFETTAKPNGKVTINVIDTRTGNVVDTLVTYATDGGTTANNNKLLKAFFPNMYVSGTNLEDRLNGKKYIFKGFYTSENGTTQITNTFTPGDAYPELDTLKVTSVLSTSNWTSHRLRAFAKNSNSVDNTYNVYALWEEKKSTKLTIIFKELSESGTVLNDTQNEVVLSVTNTIDLGDGQIQKSKKLNVTEFISGDYKYIVDGWYEEDGVTPVPESMYVNGDPLQIQVPFTCTQDSPDELTLTYVLVWKEYLNPKYKFNIVDEVSDGDHHWDNTSGHYGDYTHTFKKPSDKTHYQFVNYRMDNIVKNAGESYTHDISAQGYGTELEETFYAWWKADVTLILLDGSKELGRGSSFSRISVSDVLENNPTKIGYRFLGWTDEEDNDVTTLTFEPDEESTNPTPKTVKLYAKWEQTMVNVDVTKVWDDNDDNDRIRPDSVTVYLNNEETGATVDTVTLNEDNEWTHTFTAPEYDGENKVSYIVAEAEVPGYTPSITGDMENGFEIKNTHENSQVQVTVNKVWNDNNDNDRIRPNSVTVHIKVKGSDDVVDTVTLNEDNKWTYTFSVDEKLAGETLEYEITEDDVEGYTPNITGDMKNGFEVENKHENNQVDITVTKVWTDDNNNDRIRPNSVTVHIKVKGSDDVVDTVTLNEDNKWTATFTVDEKLAGETLEYEITEDEVEGYTPNITGDMTNGFEIENVHENEQVKITVIKTWDDNYDEDEVRPTSVTVNLMNGETIVDTVTLSEENEWTHTFTADMKVNGTTIEYTVSEDDVEFYEPTITGSMEDGFEIKNYHEPWPKGDGDEDEPTPEPTPEPEPEEPSNNPKTGDNIIINIIMLIVSMLGLASATLYVKKYNN
ncbi:MAG: Cna B-type domain-containing protein [Bacilli bacterium]|nr:Cna B-type domain-containing protein [Bacilli bacterium]